MQQQSQSKDQKNSKIKDKSCGTGNSSKPQVEQGGCCSHKEQETKGSNPTKNFKEAGSSSVK
jgi:hypothetical protein